MAMCVRQAMVEMQRMTLEFYDAHWREVGWANGLRGSEEEYLKWREMTEEEIDGRWGPVSARARARSRSRARALAFVVRATALLTALHHDHPTAT